MDTDWQKLWGASFGVLLLGIVVTYFISPDVVASHFSVTAPDAYMTREMSFGFSLGIALLINGCYLPFGLRRFLSRIPDSLWNLPDKEYWFRPENRGELYDRMVRAMGITGFGTNVVLGVVYAVVLGYNLGLLGIMWINAVAIGAVIVSLFCVVPFLKAFERPTRH